MKKLLSTAIMAAMATALLTQCGSKTAQNNAEAIDEDTLTIDDDQDIMIYGICGEGSAMNTLQIITDTNDTLNLSVEKTKEDNKVFGGYSVGDKIAAYINHKTQEPKIVINESTLLGNWLMPNPLDGSSTLGVSIKDGGIAESINQPVIIFKTWRIVDGQLELCLVREGGGDEEETNIYTLEKLDADSLIYSDTEDRHAYSRGK